MPDPTETLQDIVKWGSVDTQATVALSPWHQSDTLSLVTCLTVRLSVHQARLPLRPCSEVTTSLKLLLALNLHSWMAHRSSVSSSGHTAHQIVTAFVTWNTALAESAPACVYVKGKHCRLLCCCVDIKPIFQPGVSVKSILLYELWRCRRRHHRHFLTLRLNLQLHNCEQRADISTL